MTASERKESKVEGLQPFYQSPKGLSKRLVIDIDPFTATIIKKGDSEKLNLFDDPIKAKLGQRYVMVGFVKDNVVHLRAIPGFEYVADEKERQRLAEKSSQFFGISIDEVAFPDNAIWTGVVHTQLINKITKTEPDIVKDAQIIAFSMVKIGNHFTWLNRSAQNNISFPADPVAAGCYLFEETRTNFTDFTPPHFDLYYHLTRSIPIEFFEKMTDAINDKFAELDIEPFPRSSLGECTNRQYENKWNKIRELYLTDKPKAVELIHNMLLRNIHIMAQGWHAKEFVHRAFYLLNDACKEAEKYGIYVDIDAKLAGFEHLPKPLKYAKDKEAEKLEWFSTEESIVRYSRVKHFTEIKLRYLYHILSTAIQNKNKSEVEAVFEKCGEIPKEEFLLHVIKTQFEQKNQEILDQLCNQYSSEQEKKDIYAVSIEYCHEMIKTGEFDKVKILIQWLMKNNLSLLGITDLIVKIIKKDSKEEATYMVDLIHQLLEEKPDFNAKDREGNTLLHRAISLNSGAFGKPESIKVLLERKADPHIKNNAGETPFMRAINIYYYAKMLIAFLECKVCFTEELLSDDIITASLQEKLTRCMHSYHTEQEPLVEVFTKSINWHENPKVKAKMIEIILNVCIATLKELEDRTYDQLKNLLQLKNLPTDLEIKFDQAKCLSTLMETLEKVDKQKQLELINLVLNPESSIGKMILKQDASSRLFPVAEVQTYIKKLEDMRLALTTRAHSLRRVD